MTSSSNEDNICEAHEKRASKVKEILKERFDKDKLNIKNLDYPSWERGFQRGMEYHRELDKRVIDLAKNSKGFINNAIRKFRR